MNYALTFSDGLAEMRCTQEFVYDDAVAALTEIVDAPWRPEMSHLLVIDEGSAFSPTREGIKTMAELMDTILESERVLIAIVVAKIVHYGVGRVFEARVAHGSGRLRVFLREEAARQWLAAAGSGASE